MRNPCGRSRRPRRRRRLTIYLEKADDATSDAAKATAEHDAAQEAKKFLPRWLLPGDAEICASARDTMTAAVLADDKVLPRRLRGESLPQRPTRKTYVSLRVWTRDGEQQEVGILRNLERVAGRIATARSRRPDRRYFLRTIEGVDAINLELGHPHCDALGTPHGPRRFTMRWSQSQVQDFGERGKMLLDLDDNRFLVPDVQKLPPKERELFPAVCLLVGVSYTYSMHRSRT